MPSPVHPSEICALVPSATSSLCDRILKVFLQLPAKFCSLMQWMFNEDGTLSDAFKDEAQVIPTGSVIARLSTSVPVGWLVCNGQEVSRTTYPTLFATIGTVYGAGNGTTTFNVPDFRDRFLYGKGTTSALGDTGGESEHTLTGDELPTFPNPNNVQGVIDTIDNVGAAVTSGGAIQRYVAAALPAPSPTPSSQPHNTLPPYSRVVYLIKT